MWQQHSNPRFLMKALTKIGFQVKSLVRGLRQPSGVDVLLQMGFLCKKFHSEYFQALLLGFLAAYYKKTALGAAWCTVRRSFIKTISVLIAICPFSAVELADTEWQLLGESWSGQMVPLAELWKIILNFQYLFKTWKHFELLSSKSMHELYYIALV